MLVSLPYPEVDDEYLDEVDPVDETGDRLPRALSLSLS